LSIHRGLEKKRNEQRRNEKEVGCFSSFGNQNTLSKGPPSAGLVKRGGGTDKPTERLAGFKRRQGGEIVVPGGGRKKKTERSGGEKRGLGNKRGKQQHWGALSGEKEPV